MLGCISELPGTDLVRLVWILLETLQDNGPAPVEETEVLADKFKIAYRVYTPARGADPDLPVIFQFHGVVGHPNAEDEELHPIANGSGCLLYPLHLPAHR